MGKGPETTTITVCSGSAVDLAAVVTVIQQSGRWGIVPIQWPNKRALTDVQHTTDGFVLHSGNGAPADLVDLISARRSGVPLIVVGAEPAPKAAPDLWLPTMPAPTLFAAVFDQLLGDAPPGSPSWRRKSDMIIGNSPATRQVLYALDQLAAVQTAVIITGESGVGKELVARALHFCGPRANEHFVAINCGAIPEHLFEAELFGYQRGAFTGAVNAHTGAFETADNGTLFLDEIGEMPASMQTKLLRVLETNEVQRVGSTERKKVNFRLVTATNRNLEREVKEGRFREDLFYRIQVYPIHVAPLRKRPEDIAPIVTHHLSVIGMREKRPGLRLTSRALERLVTYRWPGNVRELVNILERAALLAGGDVIDADHIMVRMRGQSIPPEERSVLVPFRDAKTKFETEYFNQLLTAARGNVSLAAKLGEKTRKEVYDALKRLGIDPDTFRPADDPPEPEEPPLLLRKRRAPRQRD